MSTKKVDYAAERRKIEEQNAEAQNRLAELAQQEQQAYQEQQSALRQERDEYRAMAKNYRAAVQEAPNKERADELMRYALECDEKAGRIIIDGELPEVAPEAVKPDTPQLKIWQKPRAHKVLMALQIVFGALALMIAYNGFESIGDKIARFNASVSFDQRIRPYDLSNWQKMLYAVFVEFSDIPKALLKMFILTPFLLWYLYRYFIKEFFESLSPFQRCLIVVVVLLGFLFHSSFGVKL